VHQLLEIYSSILISWENKETNCFIFCDFSKAFDKVWHRGLLHKMKAYGINGNFIDWISSYLKGRGVQFRDTSIIVYKTQTEEKQSKNKIRHNKRNRK
jgi:hypothetical protein